MNDYYEIAPRLVPLLNDAKISHQVWTDIQNAVEQAESGSSSDAVKTYKTMVDRLIHQETLVAE